MVPKIEKKSEKTRTATLVARLHVVPFGGVERTCEIESDNFPFEISREPKTKYFFEIASDAHPNEGKRISRHEHLILEAFLDGKTFKAKSKPDSNGCFSGDVRKGDSFNIGFGEVITLGGPTGAGTVAIKLTKPAW